MKSRWVVFFFFLLLQNFNFDLFVVSFGQQEDSHIAHILAAGLVIQMLSQQHHKHHHHGHHHGHESRHNTEVAHHSQPPPSQSLHPQPHQYQESRIPPPQYPVPVYPVQPVQPVPWGGYGYAQPAQDTYGYAPYPQAQSTYNYAQPAPDPGMQHVQAGQYQQQMPLLPQSSPYINSHGELKQHVIQ